LILTYYNNETSVTLTYFSNTKALFGREKKVIGKIVRGKIVEGMKVNGKLDDFFGCLV